MKKQIPAIHSVQKSIEKQTSFVLPIIRMSEKTIKFDSIKTGKKRSS